MPRCVPTCTAVDVSCRGYCSNCVSSVSSANLADMTSTEYVEVSNAEMDAYEVMVRARESSTEHEIWNADEASVRDRGC